MNKPNWTKGNRHWVAKWERHCDKLLISWWCPFYGCHPPSPHDSWDRPQQPCYPSYRKINDRLWTDGREKPIEQTLGHMDVTERSFICCSICFMWFCPAEQVCANEREGQRSALSPHTSVLVTIVILSKYSYRGVNFGWSLHVHLSLDWVSWWWNWSS